MKVEWKRGAGAFSGKADAQQCYDTIIQLSEGRTSPEVKVAMVEHAKDPVSPLHLCFTWDDTVAADKYRRQEAHKIVSSIVVVEVDTYKPEAPFRAIEIVSERISPQASPNDERESHLRATVDILSEREGAILLLAKVRRQITSLRDKLRAYSNFAEIEGAIEHLDRFVETAENGA